MFPPKEPSLMPIPLHQMPLHPMPISFRNPNQMPVHVPMHVPMVHCPPETPEFVPVQAAVPQGYHKVTYEGEPGEFHCMKCLRICDYINDVYCCDEARNKKTQKKKADSHFLQMCFIQSAMKKMVDALVANKAIINEDGSCFFCRNETQHESGWCRSKSIVQLFNHAIVKEERKAFMWLNKYLDLRKAMTIAELEKNLNITTEEMEQLVLDNPKHTDLKLQLHRHRRGVRHTISNEEKFLDEENAGIHQRFVENFKARREESQAKLMAEGQLRDHRIQQLSLHMASLRF